MKQCKNVMADFFLALRSRMQTSIISHFHQEFVNYLYTNMQNDFDARDNQLLASFRYTNDQVMEPIFTAKHTFVVHATMSDSKRDSYWEDRKTCWR